MIYLKQNGGFYFKDSREYFTKHNDRNKPFSQGGLEFRNRKTSEC